MPAVVLLALYLVDMNLSIVFASRYFGPPALTFSIAFLCSLRLKEENFKRNSRLVLSAFMLQFVLILFAQVYANVYMIHLANKDIQDLAFDLQQAGVKPGDSLAELGNTPGLDIFDAPLVKIILSKEGLYWAQLSRARLIADIPEADQFFALPESEQHKIVASLRPYGVKAILLCPHVEPRGICSAWKTLPRSQQRVYFLQ
jgi:hypothetical protein